MHGRAISALGLPDLFVLGDDRGEAGFCGGEDVKVQTSSIGINRRARESVFDRKNFIRKLVRGLPVKRNSYNEFLRWPQATHRDLRANEDSLSGMCAKPT